MRTQANTKQSGRSIALLALGCFVFGSSTVHSAVLGGASAYVLLDIDNGTSSNDGTFKSTATGLGGWADTNKVFKNDGGTWNGSIDLGGNDFSNYDGPQSPPNLNNKDFTQIKADVLSAEAYIKGLDSSGASYSYDFLTNRIAESSPSSTGAFDPSEYALGSGRLDWYINFLGFPRSSVGNILDGAREDDPTLDDPDTSSNTVWDFNKVDVNGRDFTIQGDATDFVYIRVSDDDDFKLKDVNVTFSGGITSDRVFYYYEGDKVVWENVSIAGTLIAPNAFVEIKDSDIDGVVISGDGFNIDGSTDLSFIAPKIPEPSQYAAIFGIAVLGFLGSRRRRR